MDDKHTSPSLNDYGYSLAPEVERKQPDDNALQWHVATVNGNRLGPWPLVELKRRAEIGGLVADDLIWRTGWPEWRTAGTVSELAEFFGEKSTVNAAPASASAPAASSPAVPPAASPPPENAPTAAAQASRSMPATPAGFGAAIGPLSPPPVGPAAGSGPVDVEHPETSLAAAFEKPDFLRVAARISGCLSVFWFLISVTAYFTSGFQWFTGMLIFFALFLLLESLAVVVERQAAIGARLERLEKLVRRRSSQDGE